MTEIDNSYLSLLFLEEIYIDKSIKKDTTKDYHLSVLLQNDFSSLEKEIFEKCINRLNILLDQVLISPITSDPNTQKTIYFSDFGISSEKFPKEKYVITNGEAIWFDRIETINRNPELKVIFWEKLQEFLK